MLPAARVAEDEEHQGARPRQGERQPRVLRGRAYSQDPRRLGLEHRDDNIDAGHERVRLRERTDEDTRAPTPGVSEALGASAGFAALR